MNKFFATLLAIVIVIFIFFIGIYIRYHYVKVTIYNDSNADASIVASVAGPNYYEYDDGLVDFIVKSGDEKTFYYSRKKMHKGGLYICTDTLSCSYVKVMCRGAGPCNFKELTLSTRVSKFNPFNINSGKIKR